MENILYWQGRPIGIDCGTHVAWFPSAPLEAIEELSKRFKGWMLAESSPMNKDEAHTIRWLNTRNHYGND
jgi:hypothetical protein